MIQLLGYFSLLLCYVVAIGFGLRIIKYAQTKDSKYMHDYNCWSNKTPGRHTKKK